MNTLVAMSLDSWIEKFKPMKNLNNTGSGLSIDDDFLMYETFGKDLDVIVKLSNQDDGKAMVWTLVESDSGKLVIVNGYRQCDRQGYFVTYTPARANTDYSISFEDDEEDYGDPDSVDNQPTQCSQLGGEYYGICPICNLQSTKDAICPNTGNK